MFGIVIPSSNQCQMGGRSFFLGWQTPMGGRPIFSLTFDIIIPF
jgi:hypothetical protein